MLPRRFEIILEKLCDRHERSGIAVQWNGGGGGNMNIVNWTAHIQRLNYFELCIHMFFILVHVCYIERPQVIPVLHVHVSR